VAQALRVAPTTLIGAGMLLSIVTAAAPLLGGDPLIESTIWKFDLPAIGQVKLVSSSIFDLGVYALVVGVVVAVLLALGSDAAAEVGDDGHAEVPT
jgi:multisubunit Na+/H+ antiporter MnhB subunit